MLKNKTKSKTVKVRKKIFSGYRPQIRSRHPSHAAIRGKLERLPFPSVVRLGSTTVLNLTEQHVECNTVEAIRNSASKLRMKRCFSVDGITTADWWTYRGDTFYFEGDQTSESKTIDNLPYPIVSKQIYGSRGRGNTLHKDAESLRKFIESKHDLSDYIFEKFYNYNKEYRLHITKDGCFYTCRKMIKESTPKDKRWYKNDSNCVWIIETNPAFDKPVCWDAIVSECVNALNSVGLDVGACDVRVQSAKTSDGKVRKTVEFVIIEINSAPAFAEITTQKYLEQIPIILKNKKENKL